MGYRVNTRKPTIHGEMKARPVKRRRRSCFVRRLRLIWILRIALAITPIVYSPDDKFGFIFSRCVGPGHQCAHLSVRPGRATFQSLAPARFWHRCSRPVSLCLHAHWPDLHNARCGSETSRMFRALTEFSRAPFFPSASDKGSNSGYPSQDCSCYVSVLQS